MEDLKLKYGYVILMLNLPETEHHSGYMVVLYRVRLDINRSGSLFAGSLYELWMFSGVKLHEPPASVNICTVYPVTCLIGLTTCCSASGVCQRAALSW